MRWLMALALLLVCAPAYAEVIYDSTPGLPLPGNIPSLGYQATSTDQFGDHIRLAGTARNLTSATITMSSWSVLANYPSGDPAGYTHPLTLNIYAVDNSGVTPALGALLASQTINALIPWHTTPGFNGTAFNVTFDFSSLGITLPDEIIYGLAYNTQTHGNNPLNAPGPYVSLNFGVASVGPTVGTDVNPNSVFWDTLPPFHGNDTFSPNSTGGLAGYTPAILLEATAEVPEPASLAIWGLVSMAGAAYGWRKRKALVGSDKS